MTQTFVIEKKGELIEFSSEFDEMKNVKEYLKENMSCSEFAMNLVSQKKLSEKQIAWMHYLATEDQRKKNSSKVIGEYIELVQKMYSGVKAKNRKFQVRLPGVTLSTVTKGQNVGCVYVFENSSYVTKITDNGELVGVVSEDVQNLLVDANENLFELAKLYGHETGECSVCGRTLTDSLSIQMGIGPICAKRFE